MHPKLRRLLVALLITTLGLVAGCSGADDDATAAPTAFTNPTTGEKCAAWVNTPQEADGSGLRACDFPIPTDRPTRQPGMSDADFLLLGGLFGYGLGHHSWFYSPSYYDHYMRPAYIRNPGYVAYGYGHRPMTRYTTYNSYSTTVVNHVNTTYAKDEAAAVKDPKFNGYKTANGKPISADKVPAKAFSGTNVQPRKAPLGDAPTATTNTPKVPPKTDATPKPQPKVQPKADTYVPPKTYTPPKADTSKRDTSGSSSRRGR